MIRDKRPNWEIYLLEPGPDPTPAELRHAALVVIGQGIDAGGTAQEYRDVVEMLGFPGLYESVPGDQLSKAAERKRSKTRRGVA